MGVAAVVAAAGLSVVSAPAFASNSDPHSPDTISRQAFCNNPAWWHPGFSYENWANNGTYSTWVITRVTDDPHQATIYATFAQTWPVWWNC
jgi:hypothetical protein